MMLERVTEYLKAIDDTTRLDQVRRCFYLKVCEKLSRERAPAWAGVVKWSRSVGERVGMGRSASVHARQPGQLENRSGA